MSVSVIFEEICTFVLNWPFSAFLSWAISIVLGINTVPSLTITSEGFSTTTLFPVRAPGSFFFLGGATPLALALDCSMDVTCFAEWTFNFMRTKDTFIVVGTLLPDNKDHQTNLLPKKKTSIFILEVRSIRSVFVFLSQRSSHTFLLKRFINSGRLIIHVYFIRSLPWALVASYTYILNWNFQYLHDISWNNPARNRGGWNLFIWVLVMFLNHVFQQERSNRILWFLASFINNSGTLRQIFL